MLTPQDGDLSILKRFQNISQFQFLVMANSISYCPKAIYQIRGAAGIMDNICWTDPASTCPRLSFYEISPT